MRYTLRQAAEEDYTYLYNLKVACLKEYVTAIYGWDEEYQQRHFAKNFEPETIHIIVVDSKDVGQLSVMGAEDEIFIGGIYITPEWQDRGIGTAVIEDVIAAAHESGRAVSLQVLRGNPARRLYERLGFQVYEETDTHYKLRRPLVT